MGDAEHHVLTTGPLQLGMSCQGESTGTGEIKGFLFLTIPGPMTTLSSMPFSGEPTYGTITGSVTDMPQEVKAEENKKTGFSGILIVAGPDGVPHWLSISYGVNTKAETSSSGGITSTTPRGCWLLAEEI
ncbi:MAG TPA: hypothetical protein VNX67_07535 [Solirubrobacteraceae bacterium]|nr:hypothetical protein [Solirubrobacteraceae bacterium]